MQAMGITVTLNSFIQNLSIEKLKIEGINILSEILLDERWEGVAFIALYDKNGNVLLHSNPSLIGKRFYEVKELFNKKSPYYHIAKLETGEEVFISDTKVSIDQNFYILRVALHLYPAESQLRAVKIHLIFVFLSACLILLSGIIATFMVGKIEKMQIKMREIENLSTLSKVLAHEIRNPLGSIKGFAQYLAQKISEPSFKDYVDIIVKESLRLERLVNDLTIYANPEKINLEKVNLKELLQEVMLPFISENETITFRFEADNIYVKIDSDKLKQILNNLIQNACDAVSDTYEKRIIVKADKLNGKIKIEIIDTGIGMDEKTLKQALEPFFTTKPKGIGLGLAITKRLCEILKITLQIKSKKGEGTTICLTLPESQ